MPEISPPAIPVEPALARLVVDLDALAGNYRLLRSLAPASAVAAVVKANAYGLGVAAVARALAAEGCDTYFVATADEALELRGILPGACIYTLGGVPDGAAAALAAAAIRPVLNSVEEARRWGAGAARLPCGLQLDSGLTRAGFDATELDALLGDAGLVACLRIVLLLTHYASADDPGLAQNQLQRTEFERLRARLPGVPCSCANSAGVLLGQDFHGDMVRPGIALYGGRPRATGLNPVREVARLEARVLQVRTLRVASEVGYGATARVPAGTRIAIVGIGYADGYPRALSGGVGYVLVAGQRVPVLGRVSMDLLTIDVTALERGPATGDYVTLFGGALPLEELAAAAGTLGYEILTGIGARVRRVYTGALATA